MPVEVGKLCKSVCYNTVGNKIFGPILTSPLYTSLVITIFIIILILFLYPTKKGTELKKMIKPFVYIFSITGVILFLHMGSLRAEFEDEYNDQAGKETVKASADEVRKKDKSQLGMSQVEQAVPAVSAVSAVSVEPAVSFGRGEDFNSNVTDGNNLISNVINPTGAFVRRAGGISNIPPLGGYSY